MLGTLTFCVKDDGGHGGVHFGDISFSFWSLNDWWQLYIYECKFMMCVRAYWHSAIHCKYVYVDRVADNDNDEL